MVRRTQVGVCIGVVALVLVVLAGCGRGESGGVIAIRVAEQHGLAYAPLAVMRLENLYEETGEGEISWVRLNNAAAIREAIVAGRLEIGSMAIPPYLIGRRNGTSWNVLAGVSRTPVALVTVDPGIFSLADLVNTPSARIALPQPGSIQHILLSMALSREGLDPRSLDAHLVGLSHPDGMTALLAKGDVVAHFTSPPFLQREIASDGARVLVTGQEAFGGDFTFIVAVAAPPERSRLTPSTQAAFLLSLSKAQRYVTELQRELREGRLSPASRVRLESLAAYYELTEEELADLLQTDRVVFTPEVEGMDRFERVMTDLGYLSDVESGS